MNRMALRLWILVLAGSSVLPVFAEDAFIAAALTAKGAKLKTAKDGTVTEIAAGPTTELTLDDYQRIGQLRHLKRANLSAKHLPLNDETAAPLGELDQLEHFFSNGAELTDAGFKAFAGWKSVKHLGFDHWGWTVKGKEMVGSGLVHQR